MINFRFQNYTGRCVSRSYVLTRAKFNLDSLHSSYSTSDVDGDEACIYPSSSSGSTYVSRSQSGNIEMPMFEFFFSAIPEWRL